MTEYKYPHIKEEGSLSIGASNRGGKKFAKWTFKPVNADRFDIEVNILYPSKDKPLRFSAHSQYLSQSFEDTDIERLRQAVDNDLQRSAHLLNNIEWEEWLEVVVSKAYTRDNEQKAGFDIEYGKLKRGINPENGEAVTIHNNMVILPFPEPKRAGEGDDESGWKVSRRSVSDEYSYIPATSENILALEKLIVKMEMLREELSKFLSQDNIHAAICNMSKQALLEG